MKQIGFLSWQTSNFIFTSYVESSEICLRSKEIFLWRDVKSNYERKQENEDNIATKEKRKRFLLKMFAKEHRNLRIDIARIVGNHLNCNGFFQVSCNLSHKVHNYKYRVEYKCITRIWCRWKEYMFTVARTTEISVGLICVTFGIYRNELTAGLSTFDKINYRERLSLRSLKNI